MFPVKKSVIFVRRLFAVEDWFVIVLRVRPDLLNSNLFCVNARVSDDSGSGI
jgi:hypothetical protein